MVASSLSISRAWDETRDIFRRDGGLLVSVALALFVLPQTLLGAFVPSSASQLTMAVELLLLLVLITAVAGQIALNRLALAPPATVGVGISRGFARTPAAIAALLIVFLVTFAVFLVLAVLLVATGVVDAPVKGRPPAVPLVVILLICYVAVFAIFQLVMPLAAAELGGPIRLIRRSWELGKAHFWRLAGFLFLISIGMLLVWFTAQLVAGVAVTAALGRPEQGSVGLMLISLVVAFVQATWTILTSVMLARVYAQVAGQSENIEEALR